MKKRFKNIQINKR